MFDAILEYLTPARRKWARDVAERVAWTAIQVTLGAVTVSALGLPDWAVAPVAAGLALAKGVVAKHIGDPDSAALDPTAG